MLKVGLNAHYKKEDMWIGRKTILVFAIFVPVLEEELVVVSFPVHPANLPNPPNSFSIQNSFLAVLPKYLLPFIRKDLRKNKDNKQSFQARLWVI